MSEDLSSVYDTLNCLINSSKHNESECRKYLHHAIHLLFRHDAVKKILHSESELKGSVGDSDYVISGYIGDYAPGNPCVKAYVWELKAAQCYVFRKDTKNRLCPSKELFEAENQLLNYVDELRGNETLRTRFGVGPRLNVCFGGIIIGSREKLVSGELENGKKMRLYQDAVRIRDEYFYSRARIKLTTWSDVLDEIGGTYNALTKENIIPNYKFKAPKIPKGTIVTFRSVRTRD